MASERSPISAGWASVDVTPNVPCRMDGYIARTAPSKGVHDALFAHAIALGARDRALVSITCDTLHVDDELVRSVPRFMPGATVWVGATHTHSAPSIDQPRVRERLVEGVAEVARTAIEAMRPVSASWACGPVGGIATNRDHPEFDTEISLDLLCLEPERGGQPLAIVGSFPCHPTVLAADNLDLSADLPGAFRRQLQARLGADTWVSLTTGAAGNISTRHTRREQSFAELERLGGCLAEQAMCMLGDRQPLSMGPLRVRDARVTLAPKPPLTPVDTSTALNELAARRNASKAAGDLREARTIETAVQGLTVQHMAQEPIVTRLAAARLGDLALVAIPGELYNELGARLRQGTGPLLLLAYTNGYIGYIPAHEAYANRLDYEVLAARVAPGEGERLTDCALRLLAEISEGPT